MRSMRYTVLPYLLRYHVVRATVAGIAATALGAIFPYGFPILIGAVCYLAVQDILPRENERPWRTPDQGADIDWFVPTLKVLALLVPLVGGEIVIVTAIQEFDFLPVAGVVAILQGASVFGLVMKIAARNPPPRPILAADGPVAQCLPRREFLTPGQPYPWFPESNTETTEELRSPLEQTSLLVRLFPPEAAPVEHAQLVAARGQILKLGGVAVPELELLAGDSKKAVRWEAWALLHGIARASRCDRGGSRWVCSKCHRKCGTTPLQLPTFWRVRVFQCPGCRET